jgi:beta-D-xylosidase 4
VLNVGELLCCSDSIQTMEAPGCPDADGGFNQQGCATWPGHNYSLTSAMTVSDGLRGQADTNCGYASYRFSGMSAFDQQLIDVPLIDQSVRRTMKAIFQLGLFDPRDAPGQWTHGTFDDVGTAAHRQLALEAAQQSIVLLQNPTKMLPLPRGKKIVVLGPHFNATSQMLGNYRGDVCWNPGSGGDTGAEPCMQSLLAAIAAENSAGDTTGMGVLYHIDNVNTENFTRAITAAKAADFVVLALGLSSGNEDDSGKYQDWGGGGGEGEGTDRSSTWSRWTDSEANALGLPGAQEQLFGNISALGKPTCVVLINGGQVAVDTIAASDASVVEAFYPGQAGAAAIASVLFGSFNPVGKLDQTIYAKSFATEVKWWDTRLRPHAESRGRTHMFYTGTPLYRFGHGLS